MMCAVEKPTPACRDRAPEFADANSAGAAGRPPKLVCAEELLELLWEEKSRPSLRWLRDLQEQRLIPSKRLGRRVFFDPEEVRAVIDRDHSIKARR